MNGPEVKFKLKLEGGVLAVDDTVFDKPYSDPEKAKQYLQKLKFRKISTYCDAQFCAL